MGEADGPFGSIPLVFWSFDMASYAQAIFQNEGRVEAVRVCSARGVADVWNGGRSGGKQRRGVDPPR